MAGVALPFGVLAKLVVLVHCIVYALQHAALGDVYTQIECGLQNFHILFGVMAEHPVNLSTPWVVVADADAQACEVLADEPA